MFDINEQEPSKTIRELSKALSSKVDKAERVSKHCRKIDTTSPAEKEKRSVNKSLSRKINAEDDPKTIILNLSKQIQEFKQECLSASFQHRFYPILTHWDSKMTYRRVITATHKAQNA